MKGYSQEMFRVLAGFRVSAPQGVLMVTKLAKRCPKDAPEGVRRAAERMRRVGAKVNDEARHRGAMPKRADARPAVAALAGAWNALHGRLAAWTKLQDDAGEEVAEAQALMARVFPEGLRFLAGRDHGEQWLASEHRLEDLVASGEVARVEALAGAVFVASVRKAHRDAGHALGTLGEASRAQGSTNLRPMLQELVQAISEYALQVLASADLTKAAEVERVRWQLAPIDEHRTRNEAAVDAEQPDVTKPDATKPDATKPDATKPEGEGMVPRAGAANDDAARSGRRVA